MFPSLAEAKAMFAAVGLRQSERVQVERPFEGSLEDNAAQLRLRALSMFEHLSDDEWTDGLAQMDAALAAGAVSTPGPERPDVLVFSRG